MEEAARRDRATNGLAPAGVGTLWKNRCSTPVGKENKTKLRKGRKRRDEKI